MPFARDVTHIGHWGTGNLELTLSTLADLDAAKPFIAEAYEGRGQSTSNTSETPCIEQ